MKQESLPNRLESGQDLTEPQQNHRLTQEIEPETRETESFDFQEEVKRESRLLDGFFRSKKTRQVALIMKVLNLGLSNVAVYGGLHALVRPRDELETTAEIRETKDDVASAVLGLTIHYIKDGRLDVMYVRPDLINAGEPIALDGYVKQVEVVLSDEEHLADFQPTTASSSSNVDIGHGEHIYFTRFGNSDDDLGEPLNNEVVNRLIVHGRSGTNLEIEIHQKGPEKVKEIALDFDPQNSLGANNKVDTTHVTYYGSDPERIREISDAPLALRSIAQGINKIENFFGQNTADSLGIIDYDIAADYAIGYVNPSRPGLVMVPYGSLKNKSIRSLSNMGEHEAAHLFSARYDWRPQEIGSAFADIIGLEDDDSKRRQITDSGQLEFQNNNPLVYHNKFIQFITRFTDGFWNAYAGKNVQEFTRALIQSMIRLDHLQEQLDMAIAQLQDSEAVPYLLKEQEKIEILDQYDHALDALLRAANRKRQESNDNSYYHDIEKFKWAKQQIHLARQNLDSQ